MVVRVHPLVRRWLALVAVLTVPIAFLVRPAGAASPDPAALVRIWSARDGSTATDDTATALVMSPDGSTVYVAGFSIAADEHERNVTIAYDAATGTKRWVAVHPGSPTDGYHPDVLAMSPSGDVVFLGGFGHDAGMVVAYEALTGKQVWEARFAGGDVVGLGVTADGARVLATGTTRGPTDSDDYRTAAFDASTGTQVWTTLYDKAGMVDDPHALAVSPDGATVFVTGYSQGDDFYADYATIAYDTATGTQRWVARYNGPGTGYDNAADLALSPDGSTVVVTGNSDSNGPGSTTDYATVAYDAATGAQRWASTYDDPLHSFDYAFIVRVSPDGGAVFVSGETGATISFDSTTIAYDIVTGAQAWVSTYDGPGDNYDAPGDVAVSPAGDLVFVTGASYGSQSGSDYATVTYDAATGTQEDVSRIGTAGNDGGGAMGISSNGSHLFVTGVIQPSSQDFGTIAYRVVP